VAEFAARRMSPLLMTRANSLEKLLHDLALCEETLARLLLFFSAPPSDRMRNIGDSLFQPLDFLLITIAETGAAPTADGVDLLLRLTEDRGELRNCKIIIVTYNIHVLYLAHGYSNRA
jgi:hypothetical protein